MPLFMFQSKNILSCLLIVLMKISFCESQCNDLNTCFETSKPGKVIGNIVKNKNGTGYRECYNECTRRASDCQTFNYNKFSGYCELISDLPSSANIENDSDFIYSTIPDIGLIPDTCSNNPCSSASHQICIPLSLGGGTCVQECGVPSSPANGQLFYSEMFFEVGKVVSLSCNTGYRILTGPPECLGTGSWTDSACVQACDFETTCNALVTDLTADSVFEENSGRTPSDSTGCTEDHTTGGGNYYYFEASSPRQQGDTARLETTFSVPIGVQICVSLWYHMYGHSMGSLRINTKDSAGTQTNSQVIASGDQGQQWHQSTKTFPAQSNTVWIVIEGIRGSATKSDICIDDIEIYGC